MNDQWFISRDGRAKYGPYSSAQLKELADFGKLQPTDMVWREGMHCWVRADSVGNLFPPPRPAGLSTALPPPVIASPVAEVHTATARMLPWYAIRRSYMFLLICCGCGVGIGLIWWVANPSNSIVGTWQSVDDPRLHMIFGKNGTMTVQQHGIELSGTYSFHDNLLEIDDTLPMQLGQKQTVEIDGDIMTLRGGMSFAKWKRVKR